MGAILSDEQQGVEGPLFSENLVSSLKGVGLSFRSTQHSDFVCVLG